MYFDVLRCIVLRCTLCLSVAICCCLFPGDSFKRMLQSDAVIGMTLDVFGCWGPECCCWLQRPPLGSSFHTGHQSRFLDFSNWWFQPTYEKWWSESQIGSSQLLGKSICHVPNHQTVLVWSWGLWSSPAWRSPQIFTVEKVFLNQALNTKDMDIYYSIIVYHSVQKNIVSQ